MRVVYNLINSAVLAAAEGFNGDLPNDPSALAIFPAFNPTFHGSFLLASPPVDLATGFLQYEVDNPVSPAAVQFKNHIEIVLGSSQMTADGKSIQTVTFNIKDPSNVLQPVTKTLNLTATGGFLQKTQVVTSGGTATATFVAGVTTSEATIQAVDNDLDTFTNIGGLNPAISGVITFVPSPTVQSPLAASVPDIATVRTASIIFNDGAKFENGLTTTDHGGLSTSFDAINGSFTRYLDSAGGNKRQGIESTTMLQIWGVNFREFFARVETESDAAGASYWFGMFNSSLFSGWTSTPALSFGFRFFPGTDTNITAYVKDAAAVTQTLDTGVPMSDTALYEFRMTFDLATNVLTFYINGAQVAQFTVAAGLTSSNFCGVVCMCRNENSNAHPMDLSGVQVRYI